MEPAIPSPADIGGRSFRNEPLFRTVAYDLSSLELRGLGVSGCEDQDGKETRERMVVAVATVQVGDHRTWLFVCSQGRINTKRCKL